MPDEALRQRFEAVINSATEPSVRQYLEEAYRCFVAEAFNGAVVMTWNGVAYYFRKLVEAISVAFFQYNYKVLHNQNLPDELWRINDNPFMQACHRAGILSDVIPVLDHPRDCRNRCAHPSSVFVSANEALELAASIVNIVSRRVEDERLTALAILREFARTANEPDGEAIAQWVQEALRPQLAHDLLTIFERNDEVTDVSGIIGLWRELWNQLDEATQQRSWDRIKSVAQKTLFDVDEDLRTPEELVRLIVWPAPDVECPPRDRIGELFVTWLEGLAQSGQFRAVDMDLALELQQYLPPSLRERLQSALQEMTRRYANEHNFRSFPTPRPLSDHRAHRAGHRPARWRRT